jgi:hypothetical protein
MPGLGARPFLLSHPIADLAGIAQDGVMFSLRTATRAAAIGDLFQLPPVLTGSHHLPERSQILPPLSSVKWMGELRRVGDGLTASLADLCCRPQPFTSERQRVEYLFGPYEQLTAPLLPAATPKRPRKRISC